VKICEITENHATCEICEGLEGRLYYEETCWGDPAECRIKLKELVVGQMMPMLLYKIRSDQRYIALSVKRLTRSETGKFYDANSKAIVEGRVEIVEKNWAEISFSGGSIRAALDISEIIWGFVKILEITFAWVCI